MSVTLHVITNPFDPYNNLTTYEDVKDVAAKVIELYPEGFPETARIYHNHVAVACDVTPTNPDTLKRLLSLEGRLFLVVYPAAFGVPFLIGLLITAAVVAVAFLLAPKVPDVSQRNIQNSSPNNELSERTNRARPLARIPDIYGQVRSTPDLLLPPYKVYENNQEVELAYMCVGVGEYLIEDICDAETPLHWIPGSACAFYGPDTSPNSGHAPSLAIGSPILEPLRKATRLEQVVGQELRAPNSANLANRADIKFQYPDRIYNSTGVDFSDRFVPGDQLAVTHTDFTGPIDPITQNAVARYVHNGGTPYIEWQSGDPSSIFKVGDVVTVTSGDKTITLDPIVVGQTHSVIFHDNGTIEFPGGLPVGDYRTAKDVVISAASIDYDFRDDYLVTAKPNSTKLVLDVAATGKAAEFAAINGSTIYKSFTVRGFVGNYRFNEDGSIEVSGGTFADVNIGDTISVTGTNAIYTTSFNGTYNLESTNSGLDLWTLTNPSAVSNEWNEINGSVGPINGTFTQTHSTDTATENFSGNYTIASLDASRIYPSNPAAVNAAWADLPLYVNDRSSYGAVDVFTVTTPQRTVNLSGIYEIVSVSTYSMTVSNPAAIAPDWNALQFYPNNEVMPAHTALQTTGQNWVGPFFIDNPHTEYVYFNFVALNGLYKENNDGQFKTLVDLEVLVYPCDENGLVTGAAQSWTPTLVGSSTEKSEVAQTLKAGLAVPGYQLIYVRRTTEKDENFDGSVIDQVKWKDAYAVVTETRQSFGDVTTVQTKTYATGGALALKERRFNCLVTRKIPFIIDFAGGYPYTPIYDPDLQPTKDAAQIFCALSMAPKFGARTENELNFYSIFRARQEVIDYFGDPQACEFSYTFDNVEMSYEEAAQAIANTAFCVAYRIGSQIYWSANTAQQKPVLLFNHRNKLPGSEKRSITFGPNEDYDGIEFEWINPEDDSVETFYIPEDQSAVSPKKVNSIGIRNQRQATWHAWRHYYRMLYQTETVTFDATEEASLLVHQNRILVADNTRADTIDGEVQDQEVLQLTLSQPAVLDPAKNWNIFLQHYDGTTESIPATPVPEVLDVIKNVYFLKIGGIRFPVPADAALISKGDALTIVATSFTDPTNGVLNLDGTYTVVAVDAITGIIILDDPGSVNAAWNNISTTESVLRNGVNFDATRYSRYKVNISRPPRVPLVFDPEAHMKTLYTLVAGDQAAPTQFIVNEVRPKNNLTFNVVAANFDPRYFYMDDIAFWANFDSQTFKDSSSFGRPVQISTAAGKATITFDDDRNSYVHTNAANSSQAWVQCAELLSHGGSYTKAAWVRQAGGLDAYFLSNPTGEQFRINMNNRIIAGHAGALTTLTHVGFPSGDDEWHHIACTYDAASQVLRVYLDGVLKAQKTGVGPPTAGLTLQPVGVSSTGGVIFSKCDDVRYWRRAFTEQQISELYIATR